MAELRAHLDWYFQNNRRKRKTPGVVMGRLSRGWYEKEDEYFGQVDTNDTAEDVNEEDGTKEEPAVESKGQDERCAACTEPFESYWDDNKNSWMLRGAERTDNGELFHAKCIESILKDEQRKQEEREKQEEEAEELAAQQEGKLEQQEEAIVKHEPAPIQAQELPVKTEVKEESALEKTVLSQELMQEEEQKQEKEMEDVQMVKKEPAHMEPDMKKRRRGPEDAEASPEASPEKKVKLEDTASFSTPETTVADCASSAPAITRQDEAVVGTNTENSRPPTWEGVSPGKRTASEEASDTPPVKRQKIVT